MPEPEISVLLVDDHSLVRKGFRRMLEDEPGIRVVGEASDGHEAVDAVGVLKPQVVVMDFSLPSMNGAVATRRIRELHPETEVLILSMHAEPNYVRTCLDAGARGYLLKNAMDLELCRRCARWPPANRCWTGGSESWRRPPQRHLNSRRANWRFCS